MTRIGRHLVPVLLLALAAACDGGSPSAPQPAQLQAVSGSGQTALTETELAADLVVRVTDSRGQGVSGVSVAWEVGAGGGTLSAASSQTDAAGDARVRWTLGSGPGAFTVTATAAGLPAVTFSATARLPQPSRIEILGGNAQDGAPGGVLADSLAVRVMSAENRTVPGAVVTWTVTGGGGTLSAATATTNAAGIAKVRWILGAAGPNAAAATVAGVAPAAFSAYAVPVASITFSPAQPVVVRGDSLRITAVPRDSVGNPLAERLVTWTTLVPGPITVNSSGTVTGTGRGSAVLTATSEGRTASVSVGVAQRPPRVTGLAFSPSPVVVGPSGGTVDVMISARVDSGLRQAYTLVQAARSDPPNQQYHPCWAINTAPVTGTSEEGTWKCSVQLPAGSASGTWSINAFSLMDSAGVVTNFTGAELADAGFTSTFQVQSANEDITAPTLVALSVSPTTVDVSGGMKYVQFTFTAADGGVGMALGSPFIFGPGTSGGGCSTDPEAGMGSASSSFRCSIGVPADAPAGTWKIEIYLRDLVGNQANYTPERLQAGGFLHQITVTR